MQVRSLFGGFSAGYSIHNLVLLGAAGASLGAMAAPELEPKYFRYPVLWQVLCGVLGGLGVGAVVKPTPSALAASAIIGGFIGMLAPHWLKHVQLP